MSELKRCFISLDLPCEIVNEIRRIQKLIGKQVLFNGKFTEPENLHLTLKFLGEINDNKINEVKRGLREVRFSEFDAELGDVGVFSKQFVKIIWVELLGEVFELQKRVDGVLEGLFNQEERFMSHITIARVKSVSDKKVLIEYLDGVKPSKIKFRVDRFFLRSSELLPEGPVYKVVERFRLKSIVEKKEDYCGGLYNIDNTKQED